MNRSVSLLKLTGFVLALIVAAGCSSLPGLRVLTGQTAEDPGSSNLAVDALDLVMADKTGDTDPALSAAADRIEAANNTVDIIEMHKDEDERLFTVDLLFVPPETDTTTQEGQLQQVEFVRRAFEMTWLGMMNASEGTDRIAVRFIVPGEIPTLDHGPSLIGFVAIQGTVERAAAASYLAGQRNLNTFNDLLVTGAFDYEVVQDFIPYDGTPNHPLYMLSSSQS